jgi:hypothetical protein
MVANFPDQTSSNNWPETREVDGIFSDSPENAMADYNKVLYGYCSGDAHVSNKEEIGN